MSRFSTGISKEVLNSPPLDCDGGKSTKKCMDEFKKKHAKQNDSGRGGRGGIGGRGGRGKWNDRGRGGRGRGGRGGYRGSRGDGQEQGMLVFNIDSF